MPKVSIILPTYNGQAYIEEAITSILNQTFEDFELIVVDDCSTDHTPGLLESFRLQDARIKIITNKHNLKLPASLNVGHRMAQGEYLTWTSDDNTLHNNFLERLVKVLETSSEDVVYSDFNVIGSLGELIRIQKTEDISLLPFANIIGASFLYSKKVYEATKYNEELHGIEDYDFWIRSAQNFSFKHIEDVIYDYRIHTKSLTTSINKNVLKSIEFEENLKKVLKNLVIYTEESQELLFKFQRPAYWNWNYFFNHRRKFELENSVWLQHLNQSKSSFKKAYVKRLRELMTQSDGKVLGKLFIAKPQVLSFKYSKLTTFKLLVKWFRKIFN